MKKAKDPLIVPYERQLVAYAVSVGLPRECLGMWDMENALNQILRSGARADQPQQVVFGLAIAFGNVKSVLGTTAIMPDARHTEGEMVALLRKAKTDGLSRGAAWIVAHQGRFRRRKNSHTNESAQTLLVRLYDSFLPSVEAMGKPDP